MKVVYCKAGRKAVVKEVEGTLCDFQNMVHGNIETVPYENISNILYVLNENGKNEDMPFNKEIYGGLDYIVGDFFVAAVVQIDEMSRDIGGLNDDQLNIVMQTIESGRWIKEE